MATQLEAEHNDTLIPADDEVIEQDNHPAGDDGADADDPQDEADVITFGDASVAGEDESEGVRNLRTRLREIERENRELKKATQPQEDIGPKPNRDDYWDREEDEYDRDYAAWLERKRQADEGAAKQREATEAVEREISDAVTSYETQRAGLKVPNFDSAHDRVVERLGESGANILRIVAGDKSAALTYALGNSPERLEGLGKFNLGKLTDVVRLAAEIGALAKETKVERRKPTTMPESVHRGGAAARGDQQLARLEAEAAKSGDRTALIAYRRKQREAGRG